MLADIAAPPVTLGNIREQGVRELTVHCFSHTRATRTLLMAMPTRCVWRIEVQQVRRSLRPTGKSGLTNLRSE